MIVDQIPQKKLLESSSPQEFLASTNLIQSFCYKNPHKPLTSEKDQIKGLAQSISIINAGHREGFGGAQLIELDQKSIASVEYQKTEIDLDAGNNPILQLE